MGSKLCACICANTSGFNMISKALKKINISAFKRCERGATAIEYGLFVALVAVVLIGGLTAVYNAMDRKFGEVSVATDSVREKANERDGN